MADWKKAGRSDCISGISAFLATLAANVKINSKSNRNDLAVTSEHTICGLLNRMYGWNLRNANTPKRPNFPSVDLVDEEAGVAVQVTVDNSVKKVDHTLEKFTEHKLNRTFSRLILMVITTDEPTAAMKSREGSCFYGDRDIWNISYLIRVIENERSMEKLRDIAEYLEKELGYGFQTSAPQTVQTTEIRVVDVAGETSLETYILRNEDTGDFGTRIIDHSGDKSYKTTVLEKEDNGTKTIETTILIQDNGGSKDAGNEDTGNEGSTDENTEEVAKEPKDSFFQVIARRMAERKQKRQDKKARKQEKAKQKTPGKKKKWVIWLLPVVIIVAAMAIFQTDKPLEEMPEALADYAVTINGEKISLPTTLQELERLGWVCQEQDNWKNLWVPPHTYYIYTDDVNWSGSLTLTNGYGKMDIRLGNPSDHTIRFEDCIVYEITCSYSFDDSYTGEAVNTLEGPLGLIWEKSSFRDVKWPDGYEKTKNSSTITYLYKLNNEHQYMLQFRKSTQKLTCLKITNRDEAAMAALLGAAYDTQAPEYDAEALAEQLGVTMTFRIGDLLQSYDFRVGATVQECADLGYTIDKQPEFVASNDTEEVYFRCDTLNQLCAEVCNPFLRALTPENCFIGALDSRDMETDGIFTLLFSDGENGAILSTGMYGSILCGELREQNILYETGKNGETIIYPNRDNRNIKITFWESGDTGKITRIRVDICQALQELMEEQRYQDYLEEKFKGVG